MAHYKLGIYGEPAVGKSMFALKWDKPFFICTDENYEYLKPFGAKEEDHVQLTTWSEFKKLVDTFDFSKYETIVVDLIEDLYQWAEAEYCQKNRIDDLSDMGYGKAYKVVGNEFTRYITRLINQKCNVILLSHVEETSKKSNRGVEYIEYRPSSYIREKLWTLINGKLRFFFRAYIEEIQDTDRVIKKRLLSITPKPHEFQINRGLDIDKLPEDIDLDYKAFCDIFGKPSDIGTFEIKETQSMKGNTIQPKVEEKPIQTETKIENKVINDTINKINEVKKAEKVEEKKPDPKPIEKKPEPTPKVEESKKEEKVNVETTKPVEKTNKSAEIEAIRRKLGLI